MKNITEHRHCDDNEECDECEEEDFISEKLSTSSLGSYAT